MVEQPEWSHLKAAVDAGYWKKDTLDNLTNIVDILKEYSPELRPVNAVLDETLKPYYQESQASLPPTPKNSSESRRVTIFDIYNTNLAIAGLFFEISLISFTAYLNLFYSKPKRSKWWR